MTIYHLYQIQYQPKYFSSPNIFFPLDPAKLTFGDLSFDEKQKWEILNIMCGNAEVLTGMTSVWQDESHARAAFQYARERSQERDEYNFQLVQLNVTKDIIVLT